MRFLFFHFFSVLCSCVCVYTKLQSSKSPTKWFILSKGAFTLGSITLSEPEFDCHRWTVFILFYLGPNRVSLVSSAATAVYPIASNGGAEEGGKMHNIALCTYIFTFLNIRIVYKASVA